MKGTGMPSRSARVNQNKGSTLKALNSRVGAQNPNVVVIERRDASRDAQNDADLKRATAQRRVKAKAAKKARRAQRGRK